MLLELDNQYKSLEELIEKSKGLTVLDEEVSHLSGRSVRTNFLIIIFSLIIVFNSNCVGTSTYKPGWKQQRD